MMMMPVQQNQMIQNPMMQPQSPMGQMGQMSQPMGPQMMQPMMQPLMDQPLEASQQMENSQVQGGMEPANQLHEPSSQENTEINLIPKTPELTPETPPELPDSPRPLSETQLSALEKVLPMCEPKPPAALKLT